MTEGTIFFSYSRDNSDFVINLANDLREAGANVWMDQIDIKPGTRWDRSIENALVSSQTLLVILSKSSVESNNVMDEVSFALEEGKHIVPVLFEECTIPFRLRRLQFADFTGDPKKGIKTLIEALHLEQKIADKLITNEIKESKAEEQKEKPIVTPQKTEKSIVEPVQKTVKQRATPPPKQKKKSKTPLFAIASFAIIAIAFAAFKFLGPTEDEKHWEQSLASNTLEDFDYHVQNFDECAHEAIATKKIAVIIENDKDNNHWTEIKDSIDFIDFEEHLETYPNCSHTVLANKKIDRLANAIKEKNSWDKAFSEKTEMGIKAYLNEYPEGTYAKEANNFLSKLTVEKSDWNSTTKTNTVTAYNNFLKKYPEGAFAAEANTKLNSINAASTRKRDIADWKRVNRYTNTTAYYKYHLRTFKTCIHKTEAYNKIRAIDNQINYYKRIANRPSARAYYNYITRYGGLKAIYFYQAKREMYNLSTRRGSVGWVYIGTLSNDKRYINNARNFNNSYNTSVLKVPVASDLIKSRNKQVIYSSFKTNTKTTQFFNVNEVAVVLEKHEKKINNVVEIWLRVAKI